LSIRWLKLLNICSVDYTLLARSFVPPCVTSLGLVVTFRAKWSLPNLASFTYYKTVRYLYWLSTENTRKSSSTHALVSKVLSLSFIVHHFRISIILDCASILYLLYHFIYYKNPMYTTFSVVESIPPLTSRRRRPVSFS